MLPFRFVPVAEQVIARLEEFREPGKSVGLDSASVRAKEFYDAAARIDAAASAEAQRFAAGKGSVVQVEAEGDDAEAALAAVLRLIQEKFGEAE